MERKFVKKTMTVAMILSFAILHLSNFCQAADVTIEIKAMNWSYDPREISVTQGDRVTLNLTSLDGTHEFVIDEYGIHVTLERGQWTKVDFVADKPGDFYYYCAVSAHRGYGEQGILHVLQAGKIHTTLTVHFSKTTANIGDSIEATGSIDPPVGGVSIRLVYTRPDGATKVSEVTTTSDGKFTDTLNPDAEGRWTLVASWLGDETHFGGESQPAYLVAQAPFPILWVGAGVGALIVIGVVYYIIRAKRKSSLPPAS